MGAETFSSRTATPPRSAGSIAGPNGRRRSCCCTGATGRRQNPSRPFVARARRGDPGRRGGARPHSARADDRGAPAPNMAVDDADRCPGSSPAASDTMPVWRRAGNLLLTSRQAPGPLAAGPRRSRLPTARRTRGRHRPTRRFAPRRGPRQTLRRPAGAGRRRGHRLSRQPYGAIARRRRRNRRGLRPGGVESARGDYNSAGEWVLAERPDHCASPTAMLGSRNQEAMPYLADRRPSSADLESWRGPRRKLAGRERPRERGESGSASATAKSCRPGLWPISSTLPTLSSTCGQAIDQLVAVGEIKTVLDQAGRPRRKLSEHKFEGLAGAHGARAQRPDRSCRSHRPGARRRAVPPRARACSAVARDPRHPRSSSILRDAAGAACAFAIFPPWSTRPRLFAAGHDRPISQR